MKIEGCRVIVTGASAGIGADTVRALAEKGANIVLTARRQERLGQLVQELAHFPGKRIPIAGDIQQEAFCRHLATQAIQQLGGIDLLVNNAGLGHRSRLSQLSTADMQTVWQTNVAGLLWLTQAVLPVMRQAQQGQIVNVSSIVSQIPLPMSGMYCASKTAVNFLSRSLRMELRPENVRVTLVYPGLTQSEFSQARLGEQVQGNRLGMKGVPASAVAKAIVKAVEHGREEVYITLSDWLLVQLCRLFPRLADRVATNW